jgi:hypothetical protein
MVVHVYRAVWFLTPQKRYCQRALLAETQRAEAHFELRWCLRWSRVRR